MAPEIPTTPTVREMPAPISEAAARLRHRAADILENVSDAFVALDPEWRIVYANREACRINRKPLEDFVGRIHWEEWPGAVGTELERQFRRAMSERVAAHFQHRYVSEPYDVWLEIDAYPSEEGLNLFYRDISERKRAEEALHQSEARFRALFESSRDAIGVSAEGRHVFVNAAYAAMYGFARPEDLIGTSVFDCIAPSSRTMIRRRIARRAQGFDEPDTYEVRGLRRDGAEFDLENRVTHYRWQGQTLTVVIQRDITAQKRAAEALAAAFRREATLNRIGQAIRGTRGSDRIQAAAVQALGEALGVDRAFFSVLDRTQDAAWIGPDFRRADLPSLSVRCRLSELPIARAAFYPEGRTLVLPDVQTGDVPASPAEAVRALRVRSCVSVPLFDGGVLRGALSVAMADEPRAWTQDEVSLVEMVAVQTRAALDAAGVEERERRIAKHLQDALQPVLPERIRGLSLGKFTRPALDEAAVGGDFFDVFPLDGARYALVIGDVSGKGLAAAQQLALVRNSLRATLYLAGTPALAATNLNAILTAHDLLVGFVTVFVGVYDADTGRVLYTSCGHEPVLVRRAGEAGAVEALDGATGPPLGIAENAVYAEASVTLAEGDTLLLYTDGISESGPNRRELLGTDGLMRLLAALPGGADVQSQAEALVAQVRSHANHLFRDDIAVLLARRE